MPEDNDKNPFENISSVEDLVETVMWRNPDGSTFKYEMPEDDESEDDDE